MKWNAGRRDEGGNAKRRVSSHCARSQKMKNEKMEDTLVLNFLLRSRVSRTLVYQIRLDELGPSVYYFHVRQQTPHDSNSSSRIYQRPLVSFVKKKWRKIEVKSNFKYRRARFFFFSFTRNERSSEKRKKEHTQAKK